MTEDEYVDVQTMERLVIAREVLIRVVPAFLPDDAARETYRRVVRDLEALADAARKRKGPLTEGPPPA